MILKQTKNILCNNTAFNGACFLAGVCSDYVNLFTPFEISFGDFIYTIPVESFLVDDVNSVNCKIMVKSSTNNYATLGQPWFRTYYTGFDSVANQIGFGMAMGSQGSMN